MSKVPIKIEFKPTQLISEKERFTKRIMDPPPGGPRPVLDVDLPPEILADKEVCELIFKLTKRIWTLAGN